MLTLSCGFHWNQIEKIESNNFVRLCTAHSPVSPKESGWGVWRSGACGQQQFCACPPISLDLIVALATRLMPAILIKCAPSEEVHALCFYCSECIPQRSKLLSSNFGPLTLPSARQLRSITWPPCGSGTDTNHVSLVVRASSSWKR